MSQVAGYLIVCIYSGLRNRRNKATPPLEKTTPPREKDTPLCKKATPPSVASCDEVLGVGVSRGVGTLLCGLGAGFGKVLKDFRNKTLHCVLRRATPTVTLYQVRWECAKGSLLTREFKIIKL